MLFRRKNRKVSAKQMQKWIDTKRMEKVVDLLQTGNQVTRIKAIELLAKVNLIQVKKALLVCLDDSAKEVALSAANSIEKMGGTPEEKQIIAECRARWNASSAKPIEGSKKEVLPDTPKENK